MRVRVIDAGKDCCAGACAVKRVQMCLWSCEVLYLVGCADGQHFAAANGDGFDYLWLVLVESCAGVDAAVEVDVIRRRGLSGGKGSAEREAGKQDLDGTHVRRVAAEARSDSGWLYHNMVLVAIEFCLLNSFK